MSTPNIGFYEDIAKNFFQLSSNTHFICSSDDMMTAQEGSWFGVWDSLTEVQGKTLLSHSIFLCAFL